MGCGWFSELSMFPKVPPELLQNSMSELPKSDKGHCPLTRRDSDMVLLTSPEVPITLTGTGLTK